MKIEIGKRYWRRDGGVSGVIVSGRNSKYPFYDGQDFYTDKGAYYKNGTDSRHDLVAEYHEPATGSPIPHETLARLAAEYGINITASYGDEYYEYGG